MTSDPWLERVAQAPELELQPPAEDAELDAAEAAIEGKLCAELRELYRATNGIHHKTGQFFIVWPLAEVVQRNQAAWTRWEADSQARSGLIGFGDTGTGDPYCVPRDGQPGVFFWSPIGQEVSPLADTLAEFWRAMALGLLPPH